MAEAATHSDFNYRLRRLRWRARRGLLENDLVLSRFFARYGDSLTSCDLGALETLLALSDPELSRLLWCHTEKDLLPEIPASDEMNKLLTLLNSL